MFKTTSRGRHILPTGQNQRFSSILARKSGFEFTNKYVQLLQQKEEVRENRVPVICLLWTGMSFTYRIAPKRTIWDLKQLIGKKLRLDADDILMHFQGKLLNDASELDENDIKARSCVHCTLKCKARQSN